MIFVTLGTQKFEMNRLIEAMDKYAKDTGTEVFIQRGHSTYKPENCGYADMMNSEEYNEKISQCDVLLTHAGVGTIMSGLANKKPVVVFPRLSKYGEHVDDHQKQIAKAFASKNCVIYCKHLADIPASIAEAKVHSFSPYESKGRVIEDIILDFMNLFEDEDGGR